MGSITAVSLKPITESGWGGGGGGGVSMYISFGVGSITAVSLKPITESWNSLLQSSF